MKESTGTGVEKCLEFAAWYRSIVRDWPGSAMCVAAQPERRSMPKGILRSQKDIGSPKGGPSSDLPSRKWAVADTPYGPAPITATSHFDMFRSPTRTLPTAAELRRECNVKSIYIRTEILLTVDRRTEKKAEKSPTEERLDLFFALTAAARLPAHLGHDSSGSSFRLSAGPLSSRRLPARDPSESGRIRNPGRRREWPSGESPALTPSSQSAPVDTRKFRPPAGPSRLHTLWCPRCSSCQSYCRLSTHPSGSRAGRWPLGSSSRSPLGCVR